MQLLPGFIIACVVLIYAALTVDSQRKCNKGQLPSSAEQSMLKYINVTMLIMASLAVLYFGWHLFAPDAHKKAVSTYF